MGSNSGYKSGGGYAYGDQFAAFDKLPPTAREALRNANFNWPSTTILSRWRKGQRGYKTGKDVASTVARWDKMQHDRDVKRGIVCP